MVPHSTTPLVSLSPRDRTPMDLFVNPANLLYAGIGLLVALYGVSLVVKAFRGKADPCDCRCEAYDLGEMHEDLAHIQGVINGMRLAAQPETAAKIDAFLNDPTIGVRAERPTR